MTTIQSLQDLHHFAQSLLDQGYRKFLLQGELGVGKTQFVKELVELLGGNKNNVQSPTYTYMNIYHTPNGSILHMDRYRLDSYEEAFSKGIIEAIQEHDIICIEWPKRQEDYTDATRVRLDFSFNPEGHRQIEVKN